MSDRVCVDAAAAQSVDLQAGNARAGPGGSSEPVETRARERGVENETGLDRELAVRAVPVEGKQERQAPDEMRRNDVHQQSALVVCLSHKANVSQLQIPKTAVDELRRGARRTGAEVATVDQRNGETGPGGLRRDSGTDDSAADDEQVEPALAELLDRITARRHRLLELLANAGRGRKSRLNGCLGVPRAEVVAGEIDRRE